MDWLLYICTGLVSGSLAGLFGIGGGMVLVSSLQALGFSYPQAIATSSLAIVITSFAGSYQNMAMGYLKLNKVIALAIPAMITSLMATYLVNIINENILQFLFALLLLTNIYLTSLKKKLAKKEQTPQPKSQLKQTLALLFTGAIAGVLAGVFGVGGGVILVPFQMIFLNEKIKQAIQTSLGTIVFTSIAATIGHYYNGNILFSAGILIGIGGLVGAQLSTRFLPKIPDDKVRLMFSCLLVVLACYSFYLSFNN